MPKKFAGENSKAVVARARKAATREAEAAKKKKEIEDEYWKDDDKNMQRKQQRKDEKERKRQEQLEKKAELKTLIEQEVSSIAPKKIVAEKVTRAQIQLQIIEKINESKDENPQEIETHLTKPLEENVNRLVFEGDSARTVDEAISILRVDDKDEKLPEKKLKAAFNEYETNNLPRIKAENPTLRLSQVKQILKKEWMRSSENPVNQKFQS